MINLKFQIRYLIFIFITFCAVTNISAQNENTASSAHDMYRNINFENIEDQRIKDCFFEVFSHFDIARNYDITLVQKEIKASTMQAQPVFNIKGLFTGRKNYRINLAKYVKGSEEILVSELPKEVLAGWFAHELGHLVDYDHRSSFGMIIFGLRYIISGNFKRKVEYSADSIAIANCFAPEVIAMKRYILENESLSDSYKTIINKYYMSIDDVEIFME